MKDTIKNIIFDFGGVIFAIDESRTFNAFAELFQCTAQDMVAMFTGENSLFELFECGKVSTKEFVSIVQSKAPQELTEKQIIDAWNAVLLHYPEEHIELLKKLRKKYRIFLLSNTNEVHTKEFVKIAKQQQLPFDSNHDLFEKVWYSNELGMRKPNKEIFEYALKDAGLKADETLFVDDLQKNIRGAASVGIHTIQVTKERGIMQIFEDWV